MSRISTSSIRVGKLIAILAVTAALRLTPAHAQIVRGEVVDSVTSLALDGVKVTLLDATGAAVDSSVTDPNGRFLLYGTMAGAYQLHAETSGYRPSTFPAFPLAVDSVKAFRLLLANVAASSRITAAELIERVCAVGSVQENEGVILGRVRDMNGAAVLGAEVVVSWPAMSGELTQLIQGDALEDIGAAITTDSTGFYAACGVPYDATIRFHASRDDELSGFGAVEFVQGGVVFADELHASEAGVWLQDLVLLEGGERSASLEGIVVDGEGQPVAGAVVEIAFTQIETETSAAGSFILDDLPPGFAKLHVRAVGYRVKQSDVELLAGERIVLSPASLRLDGALTELAPIRVEAQSLETRRLLEEFDERRNRTTGMFTTRAEFARQGNPQIPTDVLRRMGGIRIEPNPSSSGASDAPRFLIVMRRAASRGSFGNTSSGRSCAPLAFLDGHYLGRTNAIDIDGVINLDHIEAIEAYASVAGMPQEFNRPGAACGVVVFWSR